MTDTYFEKGTDGNSTVLMLHGTGGNEKDLIQLANFIAPQSSKLGIRGRLLENGMTRYFAHNQDGSFDLNSLDEEAQLLKNEINNQVTKYDIKNDDLIVLGYSNGANIAAYMLLENITEFKTVILLHPMLLTTSLNQKDLKNVNIWTSHGENDPIVSDENFKELVALFKNRNANIFKFEADTSHQITSAEINSARDWLGGIK